MTPAATSSVAAKTAVGRCGRSSKATPPAPSGIGASAEDIPIRNSDIGGFECGTITVHPRLVIGRGWIHPQVGDAAVPKGQQVARGRDAAGEIGCPNTGHLALGQVERVNDHERQARPGECGEVTLAHVVHHIDDRMTA